jgi:tetratricopeptide (TPR) repeat protein
MVAPVTGLATSIRRGGVLGLMLVCLGLSPAHPAHAQPPSQVRDLQYGEVLYHYFQQDYFTSIIRLLMARAQARLPHHSREAELLLGGLDLSYGLRDEAERIFTRLLSGGDTREEVRNRAWFYLAKISWQRGQPERALQALEKIDGRVPGSLDAEAANLHGLILLSLGRTDEAIAVLQHARAGNDWSPYLRYNMGVALVRAGRDPEGESQLDLVGELKADDEETRLLRDKANLALGYDYLQAGSPEKSRRVLERVRLEGPLSSKALLGTGWADAEGGDFSRALVAWTELGKRNATDPAVEESLLAIPYAMSRMNLHGRAVQHYEEAIARFVREGKRLDESIGAIKNGELLATLQQEGGSGGGWLQPLDDVEKLPALRYQLDLLATDEFQEALKDYRDLLRLEGNLDSWARSIDAYDEMLAARKARYAAHEPAAAEALRSRSLETLTQRKSELAETVRRIEASGDPVGLATSDEAGQWNRLGEIAALIDRLPPSMDTRMLREKQQRLQGILYWQMNADFKVRLWTKKQQLTELGKLLATAQQSRIALQQSGMSARDDFEGFEARIRRRKRQIAQLQARAAKTRVAQANYIERLAVNELERRKKRLDAYLVQARFALAQTYDSALNTRSDAANGVAQ